MTRFALKPTLITYIIVAFLITFVFLTNPAGIGFSSDAVYLPALFSDVFIRGYHFSSWHLTPSPYFFPDMVIFFIINAVIHNVVYAFLIYAIIQSFLLLFLASEIAYLATQNKSAVLLTHIIFLLTLIFTCSGGIEAYSIIMKSAHHVGAIINGFILIILLFKYGQKPTKHVLLAIFCLSILGVASDLLFVIQFLLPLMASLVLTQILTTQVISGSYMKRFFLAIIVGGLIGFSVKYFLMLGDNSNYILAHAKNTPEVIHMTFLLFKNAFLTIPSLGLLCVIFYLAIIIKLIIKVANKKHQAVLSNQQKLGLFLLIFIFISFLFTLGNEVVINGHAVMRYLINIFWFPVFFFWLLFEKMLNKKSLLTVLCIIAVVTLVNRLFYHPPFIFNYIPEAVSCIDTQVSQYNAEHDEKIKYGISTYWQAKLTTVFSKEGLVISQYTADLHRRLWITSAENYRSSYDFAILSNQNLLNVKLIEQLNGKPFSTFKCDEDITLLIYGKDRLRVPDYRVKK